ncbi:hypothetical protein [Streptomyces yangpuensis]|uniref:hypothetical protein n=1 Tax=Streptomyces yangpuensis TaxID=1648182 RepID=UPI0037F29621
MTCTGPQCDRGIIPDPYSNAPEDLTLCPICNYGYDPRDDQDFAGALARVGARKD